MLYKSNFRKLPIYTHATSYSSEHCQHLWIPKFNSSCLIVNYVEKFGVPC